MSFGSSKNALTSQVFSSQWVVEDPEAAISTKMPSKSMILAALKHLGAVPVLVSSILGKEVELLCTSLWLWNCNFVCTAYFQHIRYFCEVRISYGNCDMLLIVPHSFPLPLHLSHTDVSLALLPDLDLEVRDSLSVFHFPGEMEWLFDVLATVERDLELATSLLLLQA
jgi:hypothetical protein